MDEHSPAEAQPEMQPSTQGELVPVQTPETKRLYRSSDQKIFLGVCGGLGEYFDIDPTLVRILFVVGTLVAGSAIVLYVVLALIMPAEDALDLHPRAAAQQTIDEATTEVRKGVDLVVTKVKDVTRRQ
jgi:phage shock protein PspC (stress-responsive transcriptional regulator)